VLLSGPNGKKPYYLTGGILLELRLLIRRIDLAMRRMGGEWLSTYGLTPTQGELLYQLYLKDGSEQHILAERLGITKASLSSLIDGLEELELVKRLQHPDDARLKQVFLTEQGKAMLNQMQDIALKIEDQMNKGFSKAEVELLEDWLTRLAKNLEGA
jgi:MarR family transcriptional regulator, transcriptional regulator for hemolysin